MENIFNSNNWRHQTLRVSRWCSSGSGQRLRLTTGGHRVQRCPKWWPLSVSAAKCCGCSRGRSWTYTLLSNQYVSQKFTMVSNFSQMPFQMQDRLACSEQNYVAAFPNPVEPGASVSGAHSLPNLCPEGRAFLLPSTFPWPPSQAPNNATALPPLITHGPPGVTLNNQVPPGVRANNYYDNFRRYWTSWSRKWQI